MVKVLSNPCEAKTAREQGTPPKGSLILCTEAAYEDMLRLAKLHQLGDTKVALLLPKLPKGNQPEGVNDMLLPTWGKANQVLESSG